MTQIKWGRNDDGHCRSKCSRYRIVPNATWEGRYAVLHLPNSDAGDKGLWTRIATANSVKDAKLEAELHLKRKERGKARGKTNTPSLEQQQLDKVLHKVREIAEQAADYEKAHGMEDALHMGVLELIATGKAVNPKALAKAALKTLAIDFARHTA